MGVSPFSALMDDREGRAVLRYHKGREWRCAYIDNVSNDQNSITEHDCLPPSESLVHCMNEEGSEDKADGIGDEDKRHYRIANLVVILDIRQ